MTNDTPENAALRKRFEEWVEKEYLHTLSTLKNKWGHYNFPTQVVWNGLQAGAKIEPVPVPESILFMVDCYRTASSISRSDYEMFFDWAIENIPQLKGTNDE